MVRYAIKDVGRKKHHYILMKIKDGKVVKSELVEFKKHRKKGESPFKK